MLDERVCFVDSCYGFIVVQHFGLVFLVLAVTFCLAFVDFFGVVLDFDGYFCDLVKRSLEVVAIFLGSNVEEFKKSYIDDFLVHFHLTLVVRIVRLEVVDQPCTTSLGRLDVAILCLLLKLDI
jgi:hypothetical protein